MYVAIGLIFCIAVCFFLVRKKKKPVESAVAGATANEENIKVAGVSYRQNDIKRLGVKNEDYDLSEAQIKKKYHNKPVYEWRFPEYPAKFEFEPENEADPNAIAIYVEGVKIGYVKRGSTSHIRNLINSGTIEKVTCKIYGGSSKFYDPDTEELLVEETDVSAKVTITKKS